MKKLYILTAFAFMIGSAQGQNQFHQSQYMQHLAFINPGAVGAANSLNLAAFYKNQWTGFDGAPVIQGISLIKPFKDFKGGWGAQILHDKIGVNNNFDISGTYAYNFKLNADITVGLGLSGVLNMVQSNLGDVETTEFNDPTYAANTNAKVLPNFRFGAYVHSSQFFAGLALPNILKTTVNFTSQTESNVSFDASNMHVYLHGGYKMEASRDLMFCPNILMKYASGTPLQFDLNVNATYLEKVGFGLSYRTSQEVVLQANYLIREEYFIGYSYDIGFSDLAVFSNGSHEIMFIYKVRTSYNQDEPADIRRIEI